MNTKNGSGKAHNSELKKVDRIAQRQQCNADVYVTRREEVTPFPSSPTTAMSRKIRDVDKTAHIVKKHKLISLSPRIGGT